MTLLLSNRDGGKTDENGHYRFHVKSWTGNILSGFAVTQNSPLGMSVLVGTGDARVDYSDYGYTLWNNASATATITTADPSNPRIDRVVVYIDRGATPQTVTPNNPGIPKIAVVAGTAAGSPVKANDAAVQSAVGSGNPWFEIATVVVGAGVTQITNANITDTRSYVKAPSNSVGTAQIDDGAVTNAKLAANTAWTSWTPTYTNITVGNGTVVSKYQQIGKTVTWHWRIVCGTTTSIGPNTAKISLPVNASSAYAASGIYLPIGYVVAMDIGVGGYYGLMNLNNSSTEVELDYSSGVNLTGTFPFTEVSGDTVSFTVTYEAA